MLSQDRTKYQACDLIEKEAVKNTEQTDFVVQRQLCVVSDFRQDNLQFLQYAWASKVGPKIVSQ